MCDQGGCEGCSVRSEIRAILASGRPPAEVVRAVELVVAPPVPERPVELNARGWPVLGTAWERHDDLEYR